MSVTVITDSAASLPPSASERLGIGVVPMTLVLGGLVYSDGDLTPDELVGRAAHEAVSTSSPTPGAFLKAVASATDHDEAGGQVLILTVSSAMSSTFEVAHVAAGYVDEAEVRVIDTGTAAGAQGLVVLAAAELAASGATLDDVVLRAEHVASRVRLMASLSSLDYLARSGRVPGAAAWAGRSLGMQAMFEFVTGGVRTRLPARSEQAAVDRMVGALVRSRPRDLPNAVLHAAVLEAQAAGAAERLRALVVGAQPEAEIFEAPFSSVMIAHTGPGLAGLAWWWEAPDSAFAP